ncbi:pentatricopeptide repeat-containing protein At1g77170-like [Chenopodium quinoa]|uniref:pentatricopeptide repeat-containing protein At1g77170-like n=1 Tax=Chenopodium quinoa TaxID=63459 RepID=UPI000B786A3C|nr:pentatricopeptide repeat-containing protein At1g77170-like [Chenopodium quinoa]
MISFSLLPLRLHKLPQPKSTIFLHIAAATSSESIDQFPINQTFLQEPQQNPAEKIQNLLSNCTNLLQLHQIHAQVIRTHYLELNNAPFYWNNFIRFYTRLNSPCYAFHVYLSMSRAGVLPDHYTLPITIKAVGQAYSLKTSQQLHGVAIVHGIECDEFVQSGLVNMYVKVGEFGDAYKVFDESPERKLGSWNAIIAGLAQSGRSRDALDVFLRMRRSGFEPDGVTMISVVSACGGLGDFKLALQLHKCVFQVKWKGKENVLMMNSVIDMYGKCGRVDLAYEVFSKMDERNVSSWTSMIVGYATHGLANEAMEFFHAMVEAGVMPNHVTFVGVLSACVHGGMVYEGKRCFHMMKNGYGIEPNVQHYGCMADLLGRAGLLEEARNMVESMPMKPNVVIWGCLLAASEKYNDVKMGEWVTKHFLELEPWNDGVYVILSNIYASRDMWEEVEKMREIMKQRRLAKLQGFSSVTISIN